MNNHAFIDAQNVYQSVKKDGWHLDWKKFYYYLRDKYEVKEAYIFMGYLEWNKELYRNLKAIGYRLIFKEVVEILGKPKANVDAELVLHAVAKVYNYDQAVIVTNDGDFACLVNFLLERRQLRAILSPNYRHCSLLLKKAAGQKIASLTESRSKLEYKK